MAEPAVGPDQPFPPKVRAELEPLLGHVLAAGRARWPQVKVKPSVFLHYLAERLPGTEEPIEAVARLHGEDLYLACGCAHGDNAALAALEQHFLSQVGRFLAKQHPSAEFVDEVRQRLCERLLLSGKNGRARICDYNGRGPLGSWLRVAAVRTAIDLRRARKDPRVTREMENRLRATVADPELSYIKEKYSRDFTAALKSALATLSVKERNALKLHFLDGMSITAIGALYRVHPSTVMRRIRRARDAILAGTRRLLCERLRLEPAELDSLMGLVESRLDINISTFFRTTNC